MEVGPTSVLEGLEVGLVLVLFPGWGGLEALEVGLALVLLSEGLESLEVGPNRYNVVVGQGLGTLEVGPMLVLLSGKQRLEVDLASVLFSAGEGFPETLEVGLASEGLESLEVGLNRYNVVVGQGLGTLEVGPRLVLPSAGEGLEDLEVSLMSVLLSG